MSNIQFMKIQYLLLFFALFTLKASAQIGIGTVSPTSTLDLRGSFAPFDRSFTGATALTASDHTLVFAGASAATATLPDATTCPGRIYAIKNFSATVPTPVLTVATVSSQQIDGLATWLLNQTGQSVLLISDGNNWEVFDQYLPASTGNYWGLGGNNVTGVTTLGTTSAYDLPFITNNMEKMRITSAGNVGIGSTTFSANPEALLVYQNNPTSFNVIGAKGSLNNYLQLNIQNQNSGANASSDVVATADNGNETTNYVDLGMNSSGYNTSGIAGGADNAYLYSAANDFIIGNSTAGRNLIFFTGGTATTNEAMRMNGTGNVGIGNSNPAYKLDVNGAIHTGTGSSSTGSLVFSNSTNANATTITAGVTSAAYTLTLPTAQGAANTILSNDGAGNLSWNTEAGAAGAWTTTGNAGTTPGTNFLGTTDNESLVFKANDQLSGKIDLTLNNAIFGYQAGQATTGNNNTFIGYQSAYANTTGLSNTAIGSNAMVANLGGANNTALGYGALKANTTGASNTALGAAAGVTNTTGADNTFIGNGADVTANNLNNATAIGYNAKAAVSNSLILGALGSSAPNVGVGVNTFSANPEALLVYQNSSTSFNVIGGKGSLNNYLQLNIQNQNAGANASSDVVATADNGNETTNFVDMGMNSSVYNTTGITGGPDNAYLYSAANNFIIGNSTPAMNLIFFTGGTATTNEAMRITGTGYIGMGTTTPGNKVEINSGTGGASGLRLKELPSGAVLFMNGTNDVAQNNNNLYFDAVNYRLSVAAGQTPASTLQVGGSVGTAIVTKTASYTASANDYTILCNNTAGAITIALPPASGCAGRIYVIKKTSAAGNNVTVQGYEDADLIDGSPIYSITTQYSYIEIQSDGTSWWIL
jgi:hypothetical protein